MIKPGIFISDRYEIIERVGSGGMADVYKAKCHRLNRFVAIKILKTEYSDDLNFVKNFRAEAQSAAGLSHPNIVNIYDVGDDNGLYYIVMELVEGITLKSFIERKGTLEIKEAIGITIQIAQGIEAAHANHIIHRDIKPQNIIISREGKVKVTDFGIAKAVSSNTITSNAMGSVHYISPEQARGGYSDEKSDIYSLGVTLYEMLSGKVPFIGDNTVSVALLHIQGEATPLRTLNQNIPLSIDRVVQKCMQKKPEKRYLSAGELIKDLKQVLSNPNGDFVKMAPINVSDSPTINFSEEEINNIKSGVKISPSETNLDESNNETNSSKYEVDNENDEEDDDIDPKLEKLMIFGSIAVGLIVTLIIIFLVGKTFGLFKFGSGKDDQQQQEEIVDNDLLEDDATLDSDNNQEVSDVIVVPSVLGMTLDEASNLLNEKSLHVRYVDAYSDVVEIGLVVLQSPEKDAEAKSGDIVNLTISKGAEPLIVPDVYGRSDDEAVTILTENDLLVKHEYDYSPDIEEGKVISTNPEKGAKVKKGDYITIKLSRGAEIIKVLVPDLTNQTEDSAILLLKNAGLNIGTINYKESDLVEKGKVIYQDYSIGESVTKDTAISFTVSKGVEVIEPTAKPQTFSYEGSVTIPQSENPFIDEMEEGVITLELTQNGETMVIYEEVLAYDDFPLTIPIKGDGGADGKIKMYLNDEVCPGQWVVSFTKVAN